MNKEQLIAKKVKHQFNGKETLFSVDSLNEHFEGLQIHESDILTDEFEDQDEGYVRVADINFDFATPNEVVSEEIDENNPYFWSQDNKDEEMLKQLAFEEELTIQPKDPAFGTEEIVLFKTPEQADAEIKKENEGIEPKNKEDNEIVKTEQVKEIKVEDPVIETGKEENVEQKDTSKKTETKSSKK